MFCQTLLTALLAALVYPGPFAPSEGYVNRTEKGCRDELCINGYWDISFRDGVWEDVKIKIPSPWNVNDFGNNGLEGPDHRNYPSYPESWIHEKTARMRKTVTVPQEWDGKRILLHFEAVAGFAEVFVDGHKVAENFDLFLPFEADITDFVSPGKDAEIAVSVRSQKLYEDPSTVGRRIVPAGSMWGYLINGIWQDVYLLAVPEVRIADVFVKPRVSDGILEMDLRIRNDSGKDRNVVVDGIVNEWVNLAETDIDSAPVPAWEIGRTALTVAPAAVSIPAGQAVSVTLSAAVDEGDLRYWTPEHPNLYALQLSLKEKGARVETDHKYERFGWREWTLVGTRQHLNGRPYALRGDSWHFMGIPQMSRRYAWAWFTAIKGMNGNAVRPHAQVYPRFYMDMADEMGICVLAETANWASDGGPKLDSDHFWETSRDHLRRMVLRDRNHASVFGWSVSNENKPVILHVHQRPDLMPLQEKAWEEWRDIVRDNDPTRPWISSDGEEDGNGLLPVTMGHYGDEGSLRQWMALGKPWGVGEHSMAYYGTPEEVARYNGQRAYESCEARMEGLANECYHLIAAQRAAGASYSTVFNMAWYALRPLPIGKRDITAAPELTDGIFFGDYAEGVPGVQPERLGPYCTTFNPGYDPNLPLFDPWSMYDAMRAANAPEAPAWSRWADIDIAAYEAPEATPAPAYGAVVCIGGAQSRLRRVLDRFGVKLSPLSGKKKGRTLYIVDASEAFDTADLRKARENRDADFWFWGVTPETAPLLGLSAGIEVHDLARSSFLPEQKSWMRGFNNADFYFCEVQQEDAAVHSLGGRFVEEGEILLRACRTDWRKWNKRPEELKTAAVLRSENETVAPLPVFVRNGNIYVSTLLDFSGTEKGARTFAALLRNAGIPWDGAASGTDRVVGEDLPGLLTKPVN